ncbi:MAG: SDR family NAD(P)-dependent oxidoreductase [Polyangiaceae bacterium]|nr:SDR family NAD(P)-dependent oxidoreductase [Polyangiaceae bacterium]
MSSGSLEGKTFVITGANTGIGRANALALAARKPSRLVIAARSRERTQPVLDAVKELNPDGATDFVSLDLTNLADVRRAADEILKMDHPIDALINNAGIAGVRGQTSDGFELAWGTNHVGHYLWTEKLLPLVKRAPQGRIVIVSSKGHYRAKGIDWDALTKPSATVSAFPEYCVSKLANVLHGKALAQRLAGTTVTTYSLHPGGVASDIWSRRMGPFAVLLKPFLISNEEGAKTQVYCATEPSIGKESGLYYDKEAAKEPSKLALSQTLQDELSARSDEWVKPFLN